MDYDYRYQSEANISCLFEDKEYDERREAFIRIIYFFEKYNIHYGIACSFNLFLRGIVDEFHDIDIIADIDDIETIKKIMNEELKAPLVSTGGNGFCESDIYLKYQVGRTDIDIIAGFRVLTYGCEILYKFNKNEIDDFIIYEEKELHIPLIPAEALFPLYGMMEGWQPRRRYKRLLIGEYLEKNIDYPEILKTYLTQPIAGWVKREIRRLL